MKNESVYLIVCGNLLRHRRENLLHKSQCSVHVRILFLQPSSIIPFCCFNFRALKIFFTFGEKFSSKHLYFKDALSKQGHDYSAHL